jgi:chromosome segregation ATPase
MKNKHLFNRFKMNLIGYSKFLWKGSKESSESSGETRKPNKEEVDLLIQRGTVEDYIKRRTGEVLDSNQENGNEDFKQQMQLFQDEMKKMKDDMQKSNEQNEQLEQKLEAQRKENEDLKKQMHLLESEKARLDHDIAKTNTRVDKLEKADTATPKDLAILESKLTALEGGKYTSPAEIKTLQEDFVNLVHEVDKRVYKLIVNNNIIRSRVDKLEKADTATPKDLAILENRLAALEGEKDTSPAEIKRLREDFEDLVNDNISLHKQLTPLISLPEELKTLSDRIESIENTDAVNPDDMKQLKASVEALKNRRTVDIQEYKEVKEKVDKLGDIDALNEKITLIKEIDERAQDLADDNTSLHEQITPLLNLPKQLEAIKKKLEAVSISPQAIKELLISIQRLKDRITALEKREPTPTPEPPEPPPQPEGIPGNEGGIEDAPEKLGNSATIIANRIYLKLKDKMPKNWKFTARYHHAKCWKYYNIRPGTNAKASEKGNTEKKYCLYDHQKKRYFYTDAWYHFLLKKLVDPQEYEKIMKFKPTKE